MNENIPLPVLITTEGTARALRGVTRSIEHEDPTDALRFGPDARNSFSRMGPPPPGSVGRLPPGGHVWTAPARLALILDGPRDTRASLPSIDVLRE